MTHKVTETAQINRVESETEYFKIVSDIICSFCKRPLLHDPRKPLTREISQRKSAFTDWVFEDIKKRYGFLYDGDLWISPEQGPCHEVCFKNQQ